MILTEKETLTLKDLQNQEKICMEHYTLCANTAKDSGLKDLFSQIAKDEQEHYQSLSKVLNGEIPSFSTVVTKADDYHPTAVYDETSNPVDKAHDALLCADSIGNEKLVSTDYNVNIFQFGPGEVRKLLNHIQTEEQQHAEMIYKYKEANCMTN